MHFSEDDLKDALRRKDPGPGFTHRVMARIAQQQETERSRTARPALLTWWKWTFASHPAMAGALATLILVIGSGLGYQQYRHVQEQKRIAAANAEQARQKMVEALSITNSKLRHVLRRVNEPAVGEP